MNPSNFSCLAVAAECLTSNSSNGQCLSCMAGFNLFSGWCLTKMSKGDPNCKIASINNYCIQCQQEYYSFEGLCLPNDALCLTAQYRGGHCLSCYSGYILYNGQCITISQQTACLRFDFQALCAECKNRFSLFSGVCSPVAPLCLSYHPINGTCIECISGYGLSADSIQCLPLQQAPANCAKADPTGKCLTCSARFYLSSQG